MTSSQGSRYAFIVMDFRTKNRTTIPVRRYGRVPSVRGQLWEERHPVAAAVLLVAGTITAAAATIYGLW